MNEAQEGRLKTRVLWERGREESEFWIALVEIELQEFRSKAKPFHLHLLLDCSASMCEKGRYDLAMRTLERLLGSLRDFDRFSLTLFSHEKQRIVRAAKADWARRNFSVIEKRMEDSPLLFSSKTYLAEALSDAVNLLPGEHLWSNRILVLTDGEIMDSERAAAVPNPWQAALEVRGVGFGIQFDAGRLVHALSGVKGRRVQNVTRPEEVPELIGMIATQGRTVAANDLRLSFSLSRGSLTWAYRHIPEAARLEDDGKGSMHDVIPLVEAGRTYRYIVACRPEPFEKGGDLQIRGSYLIGKDNRLQSLFHDEPWPTEQEDLGEEGRVAANARLVRTSLAQHTWTIEKAIQQIKDWKLFFETNFRYRDEELLARLDDLERRIPREGLTNEILLNLETIEARTTQRGA